MSVGGPKTQKEKQIFNLFASNTFKPETCSLCVIYGNGSPFKRKKKGEELLMFQIHIYIHDTSNALSLSSNIH